MTDDKKPLPFIPVQGYLTAFSGRDVLGNPRNDTAEIVSKPGFFIEEDQAQALYWGAKMILEHLTDPQDPAEKDMWAKEIIEGIELLRKGLKNE